MFIFMKKITILFTLLLAVLLLAPKVQAAEELPISIDPYTQVYDKGNGNYRLILQTDTQKSQGDLKYVIANIKLNSLINVEDVKAFHLKGTVSTAMSANYDAANHEISWTMDILDELDLSIPPWLMDWPNNVLILDFTIDEDAYGDILIFESGEYTVTYDLPDRSEDHTFKFWQNGVRVSGPTDKAEITLNLFKDNALIEATSEVGAYNEDIYVKMTIKNPNTQSLKDVELFANVDLLQLTGTTASGDNINEALLEAGNGLIIPQLEGNEELILTAKVVGNASKFLDNGSEEQFDIEVEVFTTFPNLHTVDLDEENILNSGSYVVLKTEDQMMDPDFQAPYTIDDDRFGWDDDVPEGTPFKTAFDYNEVQGELTEGESALDSDLKSVVLKEKEEEIIDDEEIIEEEITEEEEVIEEEEEETEAPEEEGEVLGDEDEVKIPEMGDNDFVKYGFILFFVGILTVMFSKKEEVL